MSLTDELMEEFLDSCYFCRCLVDEVRSTRTGRPKKAVEVKQ